MVSCRPAVIRLAGRSSGPLDPTLTPLLYSYRHVGRPGFRSVAGRLRDIQYDDVRSREIDQWSEDGDEEYDYWKRPVSFSYSAPVHGLREQRSCMKINDENEDAIHISRTPVQAPDKATGVALKKPAVSTSPPRTQSKPKSIPQHDKPVKPSVVKNQSLKISPASSLDEKKTGPLSDVKNVPRASQTAEETSEKIFTTVEAPTRVSVLIVAKECPPTPQTSPVKSFHTVPTTPSPFPIPQREPVTPKPLVKTSPLPPLSPRQREECEMVKDYVRRRQSGETWESTSNQGLDPIDQSDVPLRTDVTSYLCERIINKICAQLDIEPQFQEVPAVLENDPPARCTGFARLVEAGRFKEPVTPNTAAQEKLQQLRKELNKLRNADEQVFTVTELKVRQAGGSPAPPTFGADVAQPSNDSVGSASESPI